MQTLPTLEALQLAIGSEAAILVYFSHEQCNVCKVLKPKTAALLTTRFPKIKLFYCDTVAQPDMAAQHQVFAVPSILIWFQGRETFRLSRNISLTELEQTLARPYNLLFDAD
jgi:thioredoxin 1